MEDNMIEAHVEGQQGAYGIAMWLEDQHGRQLSGQEVRKAFKEFRITGVHIMTKDADKCEERGLPTFTQITGYTDTEVRLRGGRLIPKKWLHEVYTLD